MTVKELMDELSWYDDDTKVNVCVSYNNGQDYAEDELDEVSYEDGHVVLNGTAL